MKPEIEIGSDFRDVQIPDLVSISALWNDYVRNSLRILPNFTTRIPI